MDKDSAVDTCYQTYTCIAKISWLYRWYKIDILQGQEHSIGYAGLIS